LHAILVIGSMTVLAAEGVANAEPGAAMVVTCNGRIGDHRKACARGECGKRAISRVSPSEVYLDARRGSAMQGDASGHRGSEKKRMKCCEVE